MASTPLSLDTKELKFRRQQLGLTQTSLAELAIMTREHYCRVERGRSNASMQMAKRIARALGCKLEDIMSEDFRKHMAEMALEMQRGEEGDGGGVDADVIPFPRPEGDVWRGEEGDGVDYYVELTDETYDDAMRMWPIVPTSSLTKTG